MITFKTDFKNEILQPGEVNRVYDIKRKGTNELVQSNIYLEKKYIPMQEGDPFSAKEVNEMSTVLNELQAKVAELERRLQRQESRITMGSEEPSGGQDGDIYIQY